MVEYARRLHVPVVNPEAGGHCLQEVGASGWHGWLVPPRLK